MADQDNNKLPFSSFGIIKPSSYAYSRGFNFEFKLHDGRNLQFFGFLILDSHEEANAKVTDEIISRIKDTISYQQDLLEGNKISVTNEDFFEQCLQKINNELGIFLRDVDQSLSLHKWSVLLGMITPSSSSLKTELYLSRFGEATGWLLHSSQLETKKLISIFDTPDLLPEGMIPQKFFSNIIASNISINDQLFFCSPNLLNYVSLSEIKHVLSTLSAASALKHLENQINFSPTDRVVAALTIRLSPYPVLEKEEQKKPHQQGAETSMSNLINTQSETEKLLGNSMGISVNRLSGTVSNTISSMISKAKRTDSEVIPTSSTQRQNSPIAQAISVIVKYTGKGIESIQKTVIYFIKRKPHSNKSGMDVFAKNQTITKVNILKRQVADWLAPLSNRLNFYKSSSNKSTLKKLATHPGTIAVILVLFVAGFSIRSARNSFNQKQENLAFAETTISQVKEDLNQIDSYLIVGRESEAITLLQSSLEKLGSVNEESFTEQASALTSQLEERQRVLRKETLIDNPEILAQELSSLLTSPPKSLVQTANAILIISENPKKYISLDSPTELKSITTDISSWNGAVSTTPDQLVFFSDKAVVQATLSTSEAVSATSNVRESSLGAATFNNRVYTLVPDLNQVYRSNRAPNYSVLTSWITDESPNLSGAKDLKIDGSIYILFPDRVELYRSGKIARPNITLDAVDPPLANAEKMWLTDESNKLYILEPDRLIEFEKSGKFRQQYLIPEKTLKDIVVDAGQRIGYVLTENEVIKIKL